MTRSTNPDDTHGGRVRDYLISQFATQLSLSPDDIRVAYDASDDGETIYVIAAKSTYIMQCGSDDDQYTFTCHHASYSPLIVAYPGVVTIEFPSDEELGGSQ